jgi:hypothetical protein
MPSDTPLRRFAVAVLTAALVVSAPMLMEAQVSEDPCIASCGDGAQARYAAGWSLELVQAWWSGCVYGCSQ